MVVKGVYVRDGKTEKYPDMGYSFCNCKSIFYTKPENVVEKHSYEPQNGTISAPDVFFVQWDVNPYDFEFWNPRKYQILWDMQSLCDEVGGIECWRDFDVHSKTPKHFHIKVKA